MTSPSLSFLICTMGALWLWVSMTVLGWVGDIDHGDVEKRTNQASGLPEPPLPPRTLTPLSLSILSLGP